MRDFSPWRSGEKWVETQLHGSVTIPCTVLSIKVKHNILDDLVEFYIPKWISMSLGWKTAPKKVLKLSDLITVCWVNCLLWCLYCFVIAHVDMDMTQCITHIFFNLGNTNREAIGCRADLAVCMPVSRGMIEDNLQRTFQGLKCFSGLGCELHSPGDPRLVSVYPWECSPEGVGGAWSRCKCWFPRVSRRQAALIIIYKILVTRRLEICKTRLLGAFPGVILLQDFQVILFWIWASGNFPASHVQSGHWIFFFRMWLWNCLIYKCWIREGGKWGGNPQ